MRVVKNRGRDVFVIGPLLNVAEDLCGPDVRGTPPGVGGILHPLDDISHFCLLGSRFVFTFEVRFSVRVGTRTPKVKSEPNAETEHQRRSENKEA